MRRTTPRGVLLSIAGTALVVAGGLTADRWPTPQKSSSASYRDSAVPLSLGLHQIRGLSMIASRATGRAVIDAHHGVVHLTVSDLPPLPVGAEYRVVLVHNRPGPANSVAIDWGPGGDDITDAGALAAAGGRATLEVKLASSRLAELDVVAVVRKTPRLPAELVIGGITNAVHRAHPSAGLRAASGDRTIADWLWDARLAFRILPAHAAGGPQHGGSQQSSQLIEEGRQLFFNETFDGNGRTCATCHPADNGFTLTPAYIAALPSDDPLFVAELDPNLAELENSGLLHGPRALVLENVDGFDQPPVFREATHLFNLAVTAPYGHGGDIATLPDFIVGAITQHFPRTLNRVAGVDFRLPTQHELNAMEVYMLSLRLRTRTGHGGRKHATPDSQASLGAFLFFGRAKCAQCHGGPALARSGSSRRGGANRAFNTGVVDLPINQTPPPECNPACTALGPREANGTRRFSTPPLVGVSGTAPFFHDNSVATLRDAVAFYDGPQFANSPAGVAIGGIQLNDGEIDAITAYLESLGRPECASDGSECTLTRAPDLVPGNGSPTTDCVAEWLVSNPENEPLVDRKGFPNFKQTCTDGDGLCDADGAANGVCVFEVGVCLNVQDARLQRASGAAACSAGSIVTWELRKPRPDSRKAVDASNARALRDAVRDLAASAVTGGHQERISFVPGRATEEMCTDLVNLAVPLRGNRRGRATFRTRSITTGPVIGGRAQKDTDVLRLTCVPSA